jgi:metal-responsive CopG/Arc/MetJ family transcriptional regulator
MEDQRPPRIITPMSEQLVEKIDAWRYANRVPSRAEAIRKLLEVALHTPAIPRRVPK